MGWSDQIVTPLSTKCWTQVADALDDGWMTPDGRPRGMDDCNWSRPSRIHRHPKPMRTTRRATGSGAVVAWSDVGKVLSPCCLRRRYWTVRTMLKPIAQRATTRRTIRSWWKRAV